MEVRKLKDELESVPKEQKKDAYRQLKEEKDIQQAEKVRPTTASVYQPQLVCINRSLCVSTTACVYQPQLVCINHS